MGYSQDAVSFKNYPVPLKFRGKPASPSHNTPNANTYRTKIRQAAEHGPNFADHYTVAIWGCGSSCAMFSIVDAVDGKVYDPPFGVEWRDEVDSGVSFRRDSKAIHVVGYLDESGCSADRWYVWDGTS
jgi:hypothetical protein